MKQTAKSPSGTKSSADSSIAPGVPGAPGATLEMVRQLRSMVDRSASRWKRLIILEALGLAVAAPLAYLWLVFLLDNLFHLPVAGRVIASLGFLAAVIYLVASLIRRWRQLHFTEDQVALAMEHETPGGVQNSLINAIQLSRDPQESHAQFNQAVVEENFGRLQQIEVHQAAQIRPAILRVCLAGLVIVVGVAYFAFQGDHFRNAVARILMPFADVDPIYKTVLVVEPGNIEGVGDITIRVKIKGQVPPDLTVLRSGKTGQSSETVQIQKNARDVTYTFRGVSQSMTYAVHGGDYTSAYYRIDVPTPSALSMVKITYQYPAYTKLAEKSAQSASGDLDALIGTKAKVVFVFDQPADEAILRLDGLTATTQPGSKNSSTTKAIPLTKVSPTEFAGEITFVDVVGYQLETHQAKHAPYLSNRYTLRVLADQDPSLELGGLNKQTEANADAVLPVKVVATDDYGLDKVGLFARRASVAGTPQADPNAPPEGSAAQGDTWKPVEVWPANGLLELRKEVPLSIASFGAVEGERYEVALRGIDTDPLKRGAWTTGQTYAVLVGGEGVAMQILYEQILQSEADIKTLIATQKASVEGATTWMQKLTPASGLRWDDKANIDALSAAMKALSAEENKTKLTAGRIAREMVVNAGNLRMSVGMLADTEMVRVSRILESVAGRENPQDMRAALADGRIAEERTIRSLEEILEQYVKFRNDWETGNMIPFIKMVADRQGALRDESTKQAAATPDANAAKRQEAGGRRQDKVAYLCGITRTAFTGIAERVGKDEPIISKAFTAAAATLAGSALTQPMTDAAAHAKAGRWADASKSQDTAARTLTLVYQQLRAAQLEAAKAAMALLSDPTKSDLEGQGLLKALKPGSKDNGIEMDEDKIKLQDILHMGEKNRSDKDGSELKPPEEILYQFDPKILATGYGLDKKQEFKNLSLADKPDGFPPRHPNSSDRETNKVTPPIQKEFEDLKGPLLDEADQLAEKYDTYNLNIMAGIDEKGNVGKSVGDLNSTAAAAATGNQKQPPNDQGGASRSGREGARAHGMVVGDTGQHMRGRDVAQESQENTADQPGHMKKSHSDDEQPDTATGVGGKLVDDDHTNFSVHDAGKWKDDMANRMQKPQDTNTVVERQGERLDPRVAEMLRDLDGTQEQVIKRIKAIKKDLHNLYLPTDDLAEIERDLQRNLDSLKERPTADAFRLQAQTLDKLKDIVKVLGQAGSGFEPSLPRSQSVRGPVLDEPARQTIPGYEDAVKHYYETLATGQ